MHLESQHRPAGAADRLGRSRTSPSGSHRWPERRPSRCPGRWRCRRSPWRPRDSSWLKSARAFASLTGLACFGSALGAAVSSSSLSTKLPSVARPGPLLGRRLSVRTSSRRPVIPVSSVSADDRHDAVLVGAGDDDRAVGLLGQGRAVGGAHGLGLEHQPSIDDRRRLSPFPSRPSSWRGPWPRRP